MRFLQQLTECMGRNVKFRVKHIFEGDDLTAAANWHMGHFLSYIYYIFFFSV